MPPTCRPSCRSSACRCAPACRAWSRARVLFSTRRWELPPRRRFATQRLRPPQCAAPSSPSCRLCAAPSRCSPSCSARLGRAPTRTHQRRWPTCCSCTSASRPPTRSYPRRQAPRQRRAAAALEAARARACCSARRRGSSRSSRGSSTESRSAEAWLTCSSRAPLQKEETRSWSALLAWCRTCGRRSRVRANRGRQRAESALRSLYLGGTHLALLYLAASSVSGVMSPIQIQQYSTLRLV
mmetsp:Transcript_49993/g.161452  ORF Transcript_49993/g.161452 Transcript_49993/m.161452 type:complete len:240 (+) Transcript_49993:312-1031(+)